MLTRGTLSTHTLALLQVLRVDPDVECFKDAHNSIMLVAAAGLVVYTLGCAQSRRRCGSGELGPGADVGGVSPVPMPLLAG